MSKSPVNQLMSMMCNVSSHQWGEWILDEKSCTTRHKCKRCKTEETRQVDHDWGDWRLFPHQCVQVRVCKHCTQRETKDVEHAWSDWFINDECLELRKCNHCAKEHHISWKPKHTWGEWKNTEEYNCGNGKKLRECERCHQTEKSTTDLVHTCGEWHILKEECQKQSTCQICGQLVCLPEHTWGSWKIKDPICVEVRECQYCNELDFSNTKNPGNEIRHEYELVNEEIISTRYYTVSDNQDTLRCEWKCKRCGHVEFNEYENWYGHRHPPD